MSLGKTSIGKSWRMISQLVAGADAETAAARRWILGVLPLGVLPLGVLSGLCIVSAMAQAAELDLASSPRLTELKQQHRSVPSRVVGSPDPPPEFRVERVLPRLEVSRPLSVDLEPGSRRLIFITDQPPAVHRTTDDPANGDFDTLLTLPKGGVAYSITFHPQFADNGYMYVGWNGYPSRSEEPGDEPKHSIITRYTLSRQAPFELQADSALDIISWESNGHNGAAIAFGPDGMLYITSGDGTSDSDDNLTGQRLDLLLAKVLRIDVDHPADGQNYSVPADNPFVGQEGVRPETWAYGFRNPWRMTIDQESGHVWVGNNGQDLWEQVYLVKKGANYGWSVYEGGHVFYADRQRGPHPISKPLFDHPHSESRSLTGGVVYKGTRLPKLHGAYLYGDYSTGKIWAAKVEGDEVLWHSEVADSTLAVAGFGLDADGELLIVDHQSDTGGFYTLVPNNQPFDPDQFPRRLSETGLFTDVSKHQLHPGAIPYTVNAPLWSDGAIKERYVVLPAGTDPVKFHPTASWDFPDQTVLVKSFAIESSAGDPATRKWIETRLMVRLQGEWVGYSYVWNREQTEATLVDAAGSDARFMVRDEAGNNTELPWRYPSRTECMVCHSRAAKFVLGLSTLQLNRSHDYGDIQANQIDALRAVGVIADGKPAEDLQKLVDPYDKSQDVAARARSYLHSNCAQCHVQAGGGNAQIDLLFTKSLDDTKLIDVKPLHHTYGIEDARLIAPGEPDRSILLQRIARRGEGQMPQLATSRVDQPAVDLLREWIRSMK